MGSTISSIGSSAEATTMHHQDHQEVSTPAKQSRKRIRSMTPGTVSRRSRRVTKSNPFKVCFAAVLRAKTPTKWSYPLTPKTRAKGESKWTLVKCEDLFPSIETQLNLIVMSAVERKRKPILRKSPRLVKYRVQKVAGILKYTPGAIYQTNELVFAWEKGTLYEGKVLKCSNDDEKVNKYLVRFLGCVNGYEKCEWLTVRDILKVGYDSNRYFKQTRNKLPFQVKHWKVRYKGLSWGLMGSKKSDVKIYALCWHKMCEILRGNPREPLFKS